jgi:hypothetical protein
MTVDSPKPQCAMLDFRFPLFEVTWNFALLGYYAVSSGTFLQSFRENLPVPSSGFKNQEFLNHGDGTNRLFRNAGKKLPLLVT